MTAPTAIQPTAVYDLAQACSALGIGETKLREIVSLGDLHPLEFTNRLRFFGEDLIRLCRGAAHLPDFDYVERVELREGPPCE